MDNNQGNSVMFDDDHTPLPAGELALQTIAMPADANFNGDIFGGWLVSQMDLAGAVTARKIARGRVATVAIDSMSFLSPVPIGSVISCHTHLLEVGRSSMKICIEVWITDLNDYRTKVTEGQFTFVAIDETGRTRPVPKDKG
jgi:acyl-CoA thioesterase YciA